MKSGNKVYVIILAVAVLFSIFFFTTKLWCPDDRKKQSDNYNEQISVGQWDIQIGNAKYDKKSKTMHCLVYSKTASDNPTKFTIACFNGKPAKDIKLRYELKQAKNEPNYAMLYIYDVPNDYYFLTVELTAKADDYTSSSSSNTSSSANSEYKFNSSETTSKLSDKEVKDIKIDYRNVNEKITSSAAD